MPRPADSTPDPAAPADDQAPPGARHFKELVSFRLNILASTWSRLAAEANERDFQLDARDWRIIGMLGTQAPMSLQGLAREVNLDKSQASRSVSALIERGLLQRGLDISDGRGVQLSLTKQGRQLYRKVFPRAVRRNDELLSVLSAEERAMFEHVLGVLTSHAQATLAGVQQGRKRAAPRARAA